MLIFIKVIWEGFWVDGKGCNCSVPGVNLTGVWNKIVMILSLIVLINLFSEYSLANKVSKATEGYKIQFSSNPTKPIVSELRITSAGQDSIRMDGEITAEGSATVKERGVIYSIPSNNKEQEKRIESGQGTGKFTVLITGLPIDKTYTVKAYAITQEGISYGPEIQFDTFTLPRFNTLLTTEVNYNTEYFSIIKTESAMGIGTKISAISKPDWLTLSSDPVARMFVGSEAVGFSDGKASKAGFFAPYALTSNSMGSIFVADQVDNRIRKISPEGEVSTVAGIISSGFKDGSGIEARFNTPSGIAVDPQGYLYISDQNNHSIRKISPTGEVTTYAGCQKAGAVDGKGVEAKFKYPAGICIDAKGFIYVADRGNNLIRVISPEGIVSTLAGSGKVGFADGNGKNAQFNAPTGIAVDGSGFVYVADQVNNRIRKISPTGDVCTYAGNGEFSNRDGEANQSAFKYPTALVFDREHNLYVADQLNHSIRKISKTGKVSTIKVSPGAELKSGRSASNFKNPSGICVNKDGNIVLADYHNHNIKEIIENTTLYGTPSKSQVGSYKIVLKATNANGSTIQESRIVVKDGVSPTIVSTTPANLSEGVDHNTNISITFDEVVSLSDSGSISIHRGDEILRKYNIAEAAASKEILLSEDKKSLTLTAKDLPAATLLKVHVDNGIVKDSSNNVFERVSSSLASWSFTTKPKQKQTLVFMPLTERTYGDPMFKIGPSHSSEGLLITYYAEDPNLLFISGDSARVLKSGSTNVFAVQNGNDYYLPERVVQALLIQPKHIIIKPHLGQVMTYGNVQSDIKFDIISGTLVKGDKFSGGLVKSKGDTIGVYTISIGSLRLGNNYRLELQAGTITLQKATLLIKANDQTKIAGRPNPVFTCSYVGFVNGDSQANLLKLPELSCLSTEGSFIGAYPINISGAESKNYNIVYQSGKLNITPTGEAEFDVEYLMLLENMQLGTKAGLLKQKIQGNQPLIFTLEKGDGDTDNDLFKILGNALVTTIPLDYEQKHEFSIRVKSAGAFGESVEKILNPVLINVNESPEMVKIQFDAICSEGMMKLNGITAGPEKDQNVKIYVRVIGQASKNYFIVTQPVNGTSILSYNLPTKSLKSVNLQIILKDDGGILNDGVDSTVYNYAFKINAKTTVQIFSDKGMTLLRGTSAVLSASGKGQFQWYFNNQKIEAELSNYLKIKADESGVYSVKEISDGGCINEGQITISVVDAINVTCTNLITPNADGINDSFIARNIEQFPGNELWIMDRTGKLVYNKKGYSNDWQGTLGGSVLPNGTYYYLLDLGNNKDKLKGFISVLYEQ